MLLLNDRQCYNLFNKQLWAVTPGWQNSCK